MEEYTLAHKRASRLYRSHRSLSRANQRFWISRVPGEYRTADQRTR